MNSNAINKLLCTGCRKHTLCMRVLSVINSSVNMCYECVTKAFKKRLEEPDGLIMLLPDPRECMD